MDSEWGPSLRVCTLVTHPVPTFYKKSVKLCPYAGNSSRKVEAVNKIMGLPQSDSGVHLRNCLDQREGERVSVQRV